MDIAEEKRLEVVDPTLAATIITIKGVDYRMCFDLGALAEGEHQINSGLEYKYRIDILDALPSLNGFNTRVLFACALRHFHPEIGFEEARALPNLTALYAAREALNLLWIDSIAEPKKDENPTPASSSEELESSAGLTSGLSDESSSV